MPTYTYRREDGSTFEVEQRITEDALETCPTTGQPVKRIITAGAGLVFKGSGFYLTDYSRGSAPASSEAGNSDSGDVGSGGDSSGGTGSDKDAKKGKKEQKASEGSSTSSTSADSGSKKSPKSGSSKD